MSKTPCIAGRFKFGKSLLDHENNRGIVKFRKEILDL